MVNQTEWVTGTFPHSQSKHLSNFKKFKRFGEYCPLCCIGSPIVTDLEFKRLEQEQLAKYDNNFPDKFYEIMAKQSSCVLAKKGVKK